MKQPAAIAATKRKASHRSDLPLTSAFAPAERETERLLLSLWGAVLDIRDLGVDDDFFELNGQSLEAVTIFTEIERARGNFLPISTLLNYPTIRALAARLDELDATARESLVMPIHARGRLAPLFYAHAAYGNVLFVRRLLPYLDAEQPVFAIQARGLQLGETPHRDFASMAADYVAQIQTVQPEGPYFLAGNCAGALIAFEMAQRLRALGQDVGNVVMIDPENNPHAVPWLYWRNPDEWYMRPWQFIVRLAWAARHRFWKIYYRLGRRPLNNYPFEAGKRERQEAIFAGIRTAVRAFRPRPYDGKLTIVCCAKRLKSLSNPITGWPSLARQVEFVEAGGTHHDVFSVALPAVGATIERVVSHAQSESERPLGEHAA